MGAGTYVLRSRCDAAHVHGRSFVNGKSELARAFLGLSRLLLLDRLGLSASDWSSGRRSDGRGVVRSGGSRLTGSRRVGLLVDGWVSLLRRSSWLGFERERLLCDRRLVILGRASLEREG